MHADAARELDAQEAQQTARVVGVGATERNVVETLGEALEVHRDQPRQGGEIVATFEHHQDAAIAVLAREGAETPAPFGETGLAHFHATEEIALPGVEAGGENQPFWSEAGEGRQNLLFEGGAVGVVVRAGGERHVHSGSQAWADSPLGGRPRARVEGELVGADVEDVRRGLEQMLGAVAVVDVEVQDRHPPPAVTAAQVLGPHGDVAEEAEAHRQAPLGVVTGRAHRGEGEAIGTLLLPVGGGEGGVHRAPGGFPASLGDGVVRGIEEAVPALDRAAEALQVGFVVQGQNRGAGVQMRTDLDDLQAGPTELAENAFQPLWTFGEVARRAMALAACCGEHPDHAGILSRRSLCYPSLTFFQAVSRTGRPGCGLGPSLPPRPRRGDEDVPSGNRRFPSLGDLPF